MKVKLGQIVTVNTHCDLHNIKVIKLVEDCAKEIGFPGNYKGADYLKGPGFVGQLEGGEEVVFNLEHIKGIIENVR